MVNWKQCEEWDYVKWKSIEKQKPASDGIGSIDWSNQRRSSEKGISFERQSETAFCMK